MEESKEELKGLLVTVKEDSERVSLKLNIKTTTTTTKNKLGSWIMASGPIQFSSVAQSCPTLCDPMNRSMSGLPVHHQLPESTQIHAHRIGHELMMPSSQLILFVSSCLQYPPALGSFQWVNSSHEVAKVLEFQLQHESFQWTPRTYLLWDGLVGSCSPRDSWESSPTPQFKSINSSALSFLHCPTLTSIHDY